MQQSTLLCVGFHRYSQGHACAANQAATCDGKVFLLPVLALEIAVQHQSTPHDRVLELLDILGVESADELRARLAKPIEQ